MTVQRLQKKQSKVGSHPFPKSARLRKSREFRLRPSRRFQSQYFTFVYSLHGSGKIGISLSKKVLRLSVSRNRVRRLIREAFRLWRSQLAGIDIHVIGNAGLTTRWRYLTLEDIQGEFAKVMERLKKT